MKGIFVIFFIISMFVTSAGAQAWRLDRIALMLDKGDKVRLQVCGDEPEYLLWKSDNEAVATVSDKGFVKGCGNGDALITAVCPDSGRSHTCKVTVGYNGQNPILPPSWGLYIADGEPHVFNGRMYIFGSRDEYDGIGEDGRCDFCSRDYHVIWSDDLIHWNDAGVALRMDDIPEGILGGAERLWAPDVFRCPKTGKYYMTACTNNDRNIILDSDRPEGPYTNPRLITLDGKPYKSIDPSVLVDDDGKVYIALPKFIVAQLDPEDYSRILPETVRDMRPSMPQDNEPFEGPSLRKRGDTYYYIYIQNVGKIEEQGACPTRMAYLISKSPLGLYEYQGLIVTNYNYPRTINVHGSIEEFKGQWYVSYHRSVPSLNLSRVANLDLLTFNEDDTINQVLMTSSGVKGAFSQGEIINASGAVEYSSGRDSDMYRESEDNPAEANIVFSEKESWVGYRYMDFNKKIQSLTLTVSSESAGGRLEIRKSAPDGEIIAVLDVPQTGNKWKQVTAHVTIPTKGRDAFYIKAADLPSSGEIKISKICFTK